MARAPALLWGAVSTALLLAVAGLVGLALLGSDAGLEASAAYGREFIALGPHKPAWYAAGETLWGLSGHSELGSGELPPAVSGYAPALRQCGLGEDEVIAAELWMSSAEGPPWTVVWGPEETLGPARGCVGAILTTLPVDQLIPMERRGVFLLRARAGDL